jgi:diguanylate cyclase (GGDEF)-like protein
MQEPRIPPNEEQRLASLQRLNILDTPAEGRFDRIARLARKSLNTPIALVSLVDRDRQWFKSCQGLDTIQTPRAISFCGHAILGNDTFVVTDALHDPRFCDNPLVVGEPAIRFYAGRPIHSPEGFTIGTICVVDTVPRKPTRDDLWALEDLADLIEVELRADSLGEAESKLRNQLADAERRACVDDLTRLWNRDTCLLLLREQIDRSSRLGLSLGVLFIDVDHFKVINDTHGHLVGDEILREVAVRLRTAVRSYDSIGRYGGEEFVAVLPGCDKAQAATAADRIRQQVNAGAVKVQNAVIGVTVSIGVCAWVPESTTTVEQYVEAADQALYQAKQAGRDRTVTFGEQVPKV